MSLRLSSRGLFMSHVNVLLACVVVDHTIEFFRSYLTPTLPRALSLSHRWAAPSLALGFIFVRRWRPVPFWSSSSVFVRRCLPAPSLSVVVFPLHLCPSLSYSFVFVSHCLPASFLSVIVFQLRLCPSLYSSLSLIHISEPTRPP